MGLTDTNLAARVRAAGFQGLYQGGDGAELDLKFARAGKNFDVSGGQLAPMRAGTALPGALGAAIGTLAMLECRFVSGTPRIFVAACGSRLYARAKTESSWTEIYSGIDSDAFDFVTYEVNSYYALNGARVAKGTAGASLVDASAPIDVLLMTNASDGMLCVYGDTREVVRVTVQPTGSDAVKFGVLARHAERIWGSGIPGDPDKLMYSAPYDPFDWDANAEIPEDGAGDVLQPSWDGDLFVALRPFGSQLLAFKRSRIWRILGTDPGTYVMKEQYGGGAIVENTVAVNGSEIYMLGGDGLYRYDGVTVAPFLHEAVRGVMKRVNQSAVGRACAVMRGETYVLSLPLDASDVNNAMLEYDTREGAFTLREGVGARAFLAFGGKAYFTCEGAPGKAFSFEGGDALPMQWVSGYQSLGCLGARKRAFSVYLTADSDAVVTVCVRTEQGPAARNVRLKANVTRRVPLAARGRRFRLELASEGTDAFTLIGGVQIECDLDWD